MKKLIFTLAIASISFTSFGQQDTEFKKELTNFVEIQSGSSIDAALSQVMPMVPEGKREEFKRELKAELKDMYGEITTIYIEKIGKENLQKMLDFYETPARKNILQKTPEVMEESMSLNQKYMAKLQPIMMKYIKQ